MANMFATLAQKATTLSALMEGREKISTAELINQYPDGVTVVGFDVISSTSDDGPSTFPVCVFAEDPHKFFFGGTVMMGVVKAWLGHFEGDIDGCNAALAANDGVKLKFSRKRASGSNRDYTAVEVIG